MGEAILKYLAAVVLILVLCHEVDMTQGRQTKALMNKDTGFDSKVPAAAEMAVNAISKETNGDVTSYRPTTPGNSPGVGHKKSGGENNKEIKAKVAVQSPPDVEYSLAQGSKTDYQSTKPGHSPGAGHAVHQNKNSGEVRSVENQLGN